MSHPGDAFGNPAHAFAAALFEELAHCGVRHVCACPGSRSTPLVVAAARQPALRVWTHVDERSAAFFALGLAKATRAPVALLCTSGTAAANFYPAVIEAFYAGVPLVVLTADRPPELRGWGAPQTIDQVRLYGAHLRWFAEAPAPDATAPTLRYARALGCRAVAAALGRPAGPVHLNLPFREPLEPRPVVTAAAAEHRSRDPLGASRRGETPYTASRQPLPAPGPDDVARLGALIRAHSRGLIACGPMDPGPDLPDAVAELARTAGWPVVADASSGLRCGPHVERAPVLGHADHFLRAARFAERHAPAIVLRFGGPPTSKAFRVWLEREPPEHLVLVDGDGDVRDESHLASEVLRVDPVLLCSQLSRWLASRAREPSAWLRTFLDAERRTEAAVQGSLGADDALLEPRAVREIAEALPDGALLYVSNSMPVRDLDAFLPVSGRALRVLSNRGANGIDGLVSSALGAAAADAGPVVLLTGDLAFLHDLGGLLAAHRHELPIVVVVLNNDGGGIFSFLPIAECVSTVDFEAHFRTPHGLDLGPACETFGVHFDRVASWEHLRFALKEALASRRASVIEVPVDRDHSVAQHRAIERAVQAIHFGGGDGA